MSLIFFNLNVIGSYLVQTIESMIDFGKVVNLFILFANCFYSHFSQKYLF